MCIPFSFFAQSNEIKREIKYTAEAGTIISTNGETPFWLRANQYGIVPNQSPIFTLRGSVSSDYKKAITKEDQYKLSKFDWGYGLNIVGNVGKENQFLIPEAYVKAKYGVFEIYAGRRKEIFGLVDSTLSSGSYIWSGNALPMPKIQISNPNFVPLPFTKGFLSFKGTYAHGWFENSRTDVKNFYLHQKSLYFRLGKPDWKFHFYGGFNHQVQWGGELLYPDPLNLVSKNGKLPSKFSDYIGIVTGKSLAVESDTSKFSLGDAGNRAGNHLGTIDFGFEFNISNYSLLIYRQNIYEDGSLFYLSNIVDGLNGISITNKSDITSKIQIKKIVVEYLNTTNQSGNEGFGNTNARLRGQDGYLNNGQYIDGWSYERTGIGTPFITSQFNPNSNLRDRLFFENNRVMVYYLAIQGNINTSEFYSKISYTQNFGFSSPNIGKIVSQVSYLLSVRKPVKIFNLGKTYLKVSCSYDSKGILNENLGIGILISKYF